MTHAHHISQPMGFILSVFGTALAGTIASWVARKIQRRFTATVDGLPAFPIVLRPQRWVIMLFSTLALTVMLMALGVVAVPAFSHRPIGGALIPSVVLSSLSTAVFLKVYAISKERVTIDAEKLVHTRWNKDIEIDHRDIESFTVRSDWLHIKRKSERKIIRISLCFQNIKYLNATLKAWCPSPDTQLGRT